MENTYDIVRKRAWRYLRRGAFFLVICLSISQVVAYLNLPFHHLISEGAIIVGWVGLWRPMEMFLYDLPEMKREKK